MKDGWHLIYGYRIYVENNRVMRGILGTGYRQCSAYPYRRSGSGWNQCCGVTVSAFRAGVARGTIRLF